MRSTTESMYVKKTQNRKKNSKNHQISTGIHVTWVGGNKLKTIS